MPLGLAALFFITATLYAAVGFGGGSTYSALLVLNGTDFRILPAIALACNIVVVSGGVWRFSNAGQLPVRPLAPFIIASIPMAWFGGRLPVPETVFIGLLGGALLLSGVRLAFQRPLPVGNSANEQSTSPALACLIGGAIGLLSGIVGIGGGIFLAPILYFLNWGAPRKIAAACSLFILVNSLSGLTGQLMKLQDLSILQQVQPYWPLLLAVLIGGQIGSWLATRGLQPHLIKRLTAILILYVAARLLYRWTGLIGLFG